jgi:DNA-directed RNA polymerase subunit RPC12/RpoP
MAGTVKVDAVFKVRCACGAETAIEVGTFGRPIRCKTCSGTYKVVWGLDPRTKRKVPVTLDPSDSRSVFRIPAGAQELVCPCGQHLLAKAHQVGKKVQCPVCGAWMKLERYKDPQTLETRIRRVDPKARRGDAVKAPVKGHTQDILCTCGESLRVAPEHLGKQAQCPACGAVMRLDEKRDPQTSVTSVAPRIVGQAEPPQKRGLDEELSLDDFN